MAQNGQRSMAPPPPPDQFTMGPRFNPSMAIIMVVLVATFFIMGFCSVYIRQCANRRYARTHFDPAVASAIGGGGRMSRRAQGLDAAVIETFPMFKYSAVKSLKIGKGSLECAVCLNEFEDDETLRLIPKCSHVFHPECIDAWLGSHITCPVCRANLVPKPDDAPLGSVHVGEPEFEPRETDEHVIQVDDDDDRCRNREVPIPQGQTTPEVSLLNPTVQNRPPRSWSTGWQLGGLFPRSHSTGHSLVQRGDNLERFTLRLPDEVRNQLLNTHLNRAKSSVAFPRARSSRRGYRSRSVGLGPRINNLHYERFDRGEEQERCGCTMVPPFVSRSGSVGSTRGMGGGGDEVNANPPKRLVRSISFLGID